MENQESISLPSSGPTPATGSLNGAHQRSVEGAFQAPVPVASVASRTQLPISDASKAISMSLATPPLQLNSPLSYAAAIAPQSAGVMVAQSTGFSLSSGAITFGGILEPNMRKKRGRPRKYGPHGSIALSVAPLSSAPRPIMLPDMSTRPPGAGENQRLPTFGDLMGGCAGVGFTPHALTVAAGEDVAARIMSFTQQGHRGVCILSANGAISNATLRQPAVSGGTVTYEGRFEILSLSGSFLLMDCGGARSRTGGLSISLAGPDGRVIGGGVAGMLVAASPVQVVIGSFMYNPTAIQARPSNIGGWGVVNSGVPKFFLPYGTNMVINSVPPLFSNDAVDVKPVVSESPLNQSSGGATSSNAESPHGQEGD